MPTMRPAYMTAIRSARATTSSSSVDTMITAVPWSRSRTIRLWTNSMEPTSRPRVGWLAMSSRSGRDISRARTTFCWLPPDSEPAVDSGPPARMSNSSIRVRAFSATGPGRYTRPLP